MRVILLSGAAPAGTCGVSDYTRCLAEALQAIDIDALVVDSDSWSLHNSLSFCRRIRGLNPDIIHIQYPTAGFGTKLGPQALALLQKCIITLHEASQAHILRKLALLPFSIRPKRIIFPSNCERQFATSWIPWISELGTVIPIPSNIRKAPPTWTRVTNEIVYFGLIMPKKGIEDVLKVAALIKSAGQRLRVRVIGTAPLKHMEYFEKLRLQASALPIVWDLGLNEEKVAEKLAATSVAYLPYPDGASERRATLKAALLNGVAVITTRGPQSPSDLEGLVHWSTSPEQALACAGFLLGNRQERDRLTSRAVQYALNYTWEKIAEQHSDCYHRIQGLSPHTSVIRSNDVEPRNSLLS